LEPGDKIAIASNYTNLFDSIRDKVKNILEIGIGSVENGQMGGVVNLGYKTGNSLKCWQEYFFNANIYGIDIFEHKELNNERIYTFVADQSNESQLLYCIKHINASLDIIIDDGSHNGEHQKISFMILEKYLSNDGMYIIEDIQPNYIDLFIDLSIFPKEFKKYILDKYYVYIFDTRKSRGYFRPDDFMIAFIRK
jgi:demethylmacrocin O-methyltransferase